MYGLSWKTLSKWMIWGYHYFRKHPYSWSKIPFKSSFKAGELVLPSSQQCLSFSFFVVFRHRLSHPIEFWPFRSKIKGQIGSKIIQKSLKPASFGCFWFRNPAHLFLLGEIRDPKTPRDFYWKVFSLQLFHNGLRGQAFHHFRGRQLMTFSHQ